MRMDKFSDISATEYDSNVERFCQQFDNNSAPEFEDNEDFKISRKQERERLAVPVSTETILSIQEYCVPKNTRKSTNWDVSVWDSWGRMRNRNQRVKEHEVSSRDVYFCTNFVLLFVT